MFHISHHHILLATLKEAEALEEIGEKDEKRKSVFVHASIQTAQADWRHPWQRDLRQQITEERPACLSQSERRREFK